jgi:LacI family transcriptional regulator
MPGMNLRTAPTLKDVARATGLSINTVSLALRGSPRVPEATAAVVLAAARKLNYTPNTIARSLAERKTRMVGVVLTDLMNPILTASAKAIERHLSAEGYRLLIWCTNGSLDSEREALGLLRSRQVDGVIVYPAYHQDIGHFVALRRARHPIVLLAGRAPGIDIIASDDGGGARRATEYLLGRGHAPIGLIDTAGGQRNPEKLEGYKAALAAAGVPFDPRLAVNAPGLSPNDGKAAMAALMARAAPRAVLASADPLAVGVLGWCRENGRRVPEDIAVMGFDDIEWAPFAEVPLSSVRYPAEDVAVKAVERMLQLLGAGARMPRPCTVMLEPELVLRASA